MAVAYAQSEGIGTITLDRPPANSYDLEFTRELGEAVEAAAADDECRVVIVRSASEKFFSAGADIKAFRESEHETNMEMIATSHAALRRIASIPKLFVAEIAGHALGGGLEIALACDLRCGAEGEFRLGTPEVTLGLLPGNGGTQRLTRLVGWSRALDLMATGRTLAPREAYEWGILNRLFPPADVEQETRALASTLAGGATKAIGNIKLAVHEGADAPLDEGLARERELVEELFLSADGREGLAAFAEKRKPQFTGA